MNFGIYLLMAFVTFAYNGQASPVGNDCGVTDFITKFGVVQGDGDELIAYFQETVTTNYSAGFTVVVRVGRDIPSDGEVDSTMCDTVVYNKYRKMVTLTGAGSDPVTNGTFAIDLVFTNTAQQNLEQYIVLVAVFDSPPVEKTMKCLAQYNNQLTTPVKVNLEE